MTTFTIRIEANNLRVARNEVNALNKYLEYMEAEYAVGGNPIPQKEEPVAAKTPVKKAQKKAPAKKKAPVEEDHKVEVKEPEVKEENIVKPADIVALAREAVGATGDRKKVDGVIKRYGASIPKITENNYKAVCADLRALIGK